MNTRPVIVAATVAGAGTLGWVAFRMYVRSEVVRVLEKEYDWANIVKGFETLKAIGIDVRLPSAPELAESLTPIWSIVMPEAAINDILENGRRSRYWPPSYRGSGTEILEPYLLAGVRKAVEGKVAPKDVAKTIVSGSLEAIIKSAYHKK
jgi:hypothetical protein